MKDSYMKRILVEFLKGMSNYAGKNILRFVRSKRRTCQKKLLKKLLRTACKHVTEN